MSFVRAKNIKGHTYYYLVENKREGKRVRQRVVKYLGKGGSSASSGASSAVKREKRSASAAALEAGSITRATDKFFRSHSGLRHDRGCTAFDVVNYEGVELGNDYILEQAKNNVNLDDLKTRHASALVWVTRTKKDAARYGTPELVTVPEGSRVVATDPDGGLLVLKAGKDS